jgi:aerobic carbon-monoxide dehydrogenase medium subunit
VDINGIEPLSGVERVNGQIKIGATTRQRDAAMHPLVKQQLPVLADAIGYIGHAAIQNRGTIGGSLAHADPAAELPMIALALNATLHMQRKDAVRSVRAEEFFTGYLSTALLADELLTGVSFGVPPVGTGWSFTEVARRHGDFAIAAVAALLTVNETGSITWARVALGGIGPTPVRARLAERVLIGEAPSDNVFRAAAATVGDVLDPPDDVHASADYRRHLAEVLTRRALTTALSRAGRGNA